MTDIATQATKLNVIEGATIFAPDQTDFDCVDPNVDLPILKDAEGGLYFECRMGRHYLDTGTLNNDDEYVGFSLKVPL